MAFKHVDRRFALMTENDLLAGTFTLTDRRSGEITTYETADDLVAVGWALD